MAITNNKEIQTAALKGGYAVGAFNTSNLEITQAILEAAEEQKSPIIIATSSSAIKYAGIDTLYHMFKTLAEKVSVPVSLHLDHGKDFDIIIACIRNGWTSVMYDGSHEPIDKNIEYTKKIVEIAHAVGISVEAELGRLVGIEDEVSVSDKEGALTNPDEAVRFVEETGCDTLAIAIGTSHGAYKFKGEPELDFERLKEIQNRVNIPLVLHGASSVIPEILSLARKYGADLKDAKGVPAKDIEKAISLGITKVNIDTDLRLAFTAYVREFLALNADVFDPRKIIMAGKQGIKDVVSKKIEILGSGGKA